MAEVEAVASDAAGEMAGGVMWLIGGSGWCGWWSTDWWVTDW